MKNIKYYMLAYISIIYVFLEKYITLLYLLFKIHFVDENKNVDFAVDKNGKKYLKFNHHKQLPNVQITRFCNLLQKDAIFRIDICMTNKYILIHIMKITDLPFRRNGYENNLSRYIFSKRNHRNEEVGETFYQLISKNLEYYFKKKDAIIYTKQYNNDNGRSSRFLYKNK